MSKKKELNVKAPGDFEPIFSNVVYIKHKDDEFNLRFIQTIPDTSEGILKAAISVTPKHAKRILNALRKNIEMYEEKFEEIELPEEEGEKEEKHYG